MNAKRLRAAMFAGVLIAFPCMGQTSSAPGSAPKSATAAATPEQAQLLKSAETFLRNLFAWGPEFKVDVGPLGSSAAPDFYSVPLEVTFNGQKESGTVFMSKDGKTVIQGQMFDTGVDPYAKNRAKIHLDGNPSKGPADAKVTLVEFADFECPHCRALHQELGAFEEHYPQIRIVYKDFPLTQIHDWAETAAIGARCAYMQSPNAFWKLHDAIFDSQDLISAENVWDKLNGFAKDAGLNGETFKTCLASPEAKQAVDANAAEAVALGVNSTPTVYVNGRPNVGEDPGQLSQIIDFELARSK